MGEKRAYRLSVGSGEIAVFSSEDGLLSFINKLLKSSTLRYDDDENGTFKKVLIPFNSKIEIQIIDVVTE